jgi:hypothetical protein
VKIKSLLTIGIAVSAITASGAFTPARSVTLQNGDFNTNNLTNGTLIDGTQGSSGVLSNGTATATGWTFGGGLNWLVSTGTAYKDNLNIKGGRTDSTQKLYGTAPITSPNGTANWFVVADGDPTFRSTISQNLTDLIAGTKYDVSFWQAAAQQTTFTGGTTERWQVSLGGSPTQLSTLMSPIQPGGDGLGGGTATGVRAWQKQTLTFTAGSTSKALSFLAVGAPSGMPPLSLLTAVSITESNPTAVPEPLTFLGTMTALGFGASIKSTPFPPEDYRIRL